MAYEYPFRLKSDFARARTPDVAMAASLGLITTRLSPDSDCFTNEWRVTPAGLYALARGI